MGSGEEVETEFRKQDVCQGSAPAKGGEQEDLSRGRNERASQDQQTLREFGEGSGTSIPPGFISIRLRGMWPLCQGSVNFDQPAMPPVSL